MTLLRMAVRSVLRQPERTLLSFLMIASSMAGLVLFKGYVDDTIHAIERISTDMHFGHLQIAKKSYWDNTFRNASEKSIAADSGLKEKLLKLPNVRTCSGRLHTFGILSFGSRTENISLMGYEIEAEKSVPQALKILSGAYFRQGSGKEILIGHLLAQRLSVKPGDVVTLLVNTIDGTINAGEFSVQGTFAAGSEEIDKYFGYLPLTSLQELMQTSGVDLLMLRLHDARDLTLRRSEVENLVSGEKDYLVRDWISLSELFRKVKNFYDMQNVIIRSILISIVALGILNTIGMSVLERVGEFGTMLSLGTPQNFIYKLVLLEAAVLAFAGTLTGSALALFIGQSVNLADIRTDIPGASMPVKVQFLFSAEAFLEAGVLIVLATLVAALLPSYRALKLPIVDSLRRNL